MSRPFVYINMAMTADGKITSALREEPAFASRLDKKTMDRLRAEAYAVLVGAGTLRADNPPLHVRDPEMKAHRAALGKPAGLVNVLVTASAEIRSRRPVLPRRRRGRADRRHGRGRPRRSPRGSRSRRGLDRGTGRVALPELLARLKARGISASSSRGRRAQLGVRAGRPVRRAASPSSPRSWAAATAPRSARVRV
jgi:2,5-diamino-6-(ribosylamino)-4(3H)-pyrimidinone 5'-phosphate reductase